MNNRIDAIYARQSVDKKDSISIESQIEFCKYELKGGNCKEYTDKGYSCKITEMCIRDSGNAALLHTQIYILIRVFDEQWNPAFRPAVKPRNPDAL